MEWYVWGHGIGKVFVRWVGWWILLENKERDYKILLNVGLKSKTSSFTCVKLE